MDIPANSWEEGKDYKVNDIVRVGNLSIPEAGGARDSDGNLLNILVDQEDREFITEDSFVIATETTESIDIHHSREVFVGGSFFINPSLDYSIRCMVRKGSTTSATIDQNTTLIKQKEENGGYVIDVDKSIGVGVGIKFYDEAGKEVGVSDLRNTHRLMASKELSRKDYYNVQLDIENTSIPETAKRAQLIAFVYGMKSGSFVFKQVGATNLSRFFYCTQDHNSSGTNQPNILNGANYWTQDFVWRPGYGSKADFISLNDKLKLGEGSDYVTNLAINSLPMQLSLQFGNRTDKEARAIVHFLEEKFFPYESIFALDYKGNRLLSSDVGAFNFKYTYPYREDLKFTCTQFNHTKSYRNNNNISATFICRTESTLRSVSSHHGYNKRLDGLIPVFIDEDMMFEKGVTVKLNTFSLEETSSEEEEGGEEGGGESYGSSPAETLTNVLEISRYPEEASEPITGGKISFKTPTELDVGSCLFIDIPDSYNSIFDVGKVNVIKKLSESEYVFSPLRDTGSEAPISSRTPISTDTDDELIETEEEEQALAILNLTASNPATVKKLNRCPEDCLTSKISLPEGLERITSSFVNPDTGETQKRIVLSKSYRKLQLESDIDEDTGSVFVTPLETFFVKSTDDFQLLIPAVRGRHSIYIKNPNENIKYPWLEVRNFDHKPSNTFSIEQTPDHIQSSFVDYYNKQFKRGINQNLSTFNVVFDKRSDKEASEILEFLESHLGYKKFRFQMPRPYLKDDEHLTTQSRPYMSTFFCPNWGHNLVYKNNHTISATFIESVSTKEEDLRSVFGIGRKEQLPCVGAEIYDPITSHDLCTFSSAAEMGISKGFVSDGGKTKVITKDKMVDLIFIVDPSGSMSAEIRGNFSPVQKWAAALDVIKKMVTAFDEYIMPGTNSYGGVFDCPDVSFSDLSGDNNIPPWAVNEPNGNLESLMGATFTDGQTYDQIYQNLETAGYNLENLDRFKIKIEPKKVNVGLVIMGHGYGDNVVPTIQIDLSSGLIKSIDKLELFKNITGSRAGGGENIEKAIQLALAQLYNSPRAKDVTDRMIIMLSDFITTTGDATGFNNIPNTYSPLGLEICKQLRRGGKLAKRRPLDAVLGNYGSLLSKLNNYKNLPSNNNQSQYRYTDYSTIRTEQNPNWYNQELPTIFIPATIGINGFTSSYAKQYAYDYDSSNPGRNLQFFFPITDGGINSEELNRLLDLIKTVEVLTSDSGYSNVITLTVHNCGPHDITLLNTVVNIGGQTTPLKWTTETLSSGVVKGGLITDMQFVSDVYDKNNIRKGYGGQYYGDSQNQNLITEGSVASNILWESFNTKYEVYRNGVVEDLNGGWKINKIETQGVKNLGVAFKGMPVRVFKGDNGLEIVDYNIGNASAVNNYKGDYSHLPKLRAGEQIDLFFGVRAGRVSNLAEEVQFLLNSDDGTRKRMDCYANVKFEVTSPSQEMAAQDNDSEQAPTLPS